MNKENANEFKKVVVHTYNPQYLVRLKRVNNKLYVYFRNSYETLASVTIEV